jgi:hypothetical protein
LMDRTRSALPLVVAVVTTFVAGLQIAFGGRRLGQPRPAGC